MHAEIQPHVTVCEQHIALRVRKVQRNKRDESTWRIRPFSHAYVRLCLTQTDTLNFTAWRSKFDALLLNCVICSKNVMHISSASLTDSVAIEQNWKKPSVFTLQACIATLQVEVRAIHCCSFVNGCVRLTRRAHRESSAWGARGACARAPDTHAQSACAASLLEPRRLVGVGPLQLDVELFERRLERRLVAREVRRHGVVEQQQLLVHHFHLQNRNKVTIQKSLKGNKRRNEGDCFRASTITVTTQRYSTRNTSWGGDTEHSNVVWSLSSQRQSWDGVF